MEKKRDQQRGKKETPKTLKVGSKKSAFLCSLKKKKRERADYKTGLPTWAYSITEDRHIKPILKQLILLPCVLNHHFPMIWLKKAKMLIIEALNLALTAVCK